MRRALGLAHRPTQGKGHHTSGKAGHRWCLAESDTSTVKDFICGYLGRCPGGGASCRRCDDSGVQKVPVYGGRWGEGAKATPTDGRAGRALPPPSAKATQTFFRF